MYIVDVLDNPTNYNGLKVTFEFNSYNDCANFIQLVVRFNKHYSCIVTYEPKNAKEGD